MYALVANPGSLPGGEVMLWVYLWAFVATMPVATFMLLLFPDGRLPSPRWRPVAWLAAVGMTGVALHSAFAPGRIADFPRDNPLGLGGVAGQIADLLAISFALVTIAALASVASPPERRSRTASEATDASTAMITSAKETASKSAIWPATPPSPSGLSRGKLSLIHI